MAGPFQLLRNLAHSPRLTVVMIVDVVSSTALFEALGDREARDRIGARLDDVARTVRRHRGRVVKSMGDGLLCTLRSPAAALDSATTILAEAGNGPDLRVGIHAGEVIEEKGDVFGDAVNTAARVASVCNPGEVLVSGAVAKALTPAQRVSLRRVQPVTVKGKSEPLALYALMDGQTGHVEQTLLAALATPRPASSSRLTLVAAGSSVSLGNGRSEVTLGRDQDSDLVVAHPLASRLHAVVMQRHGRFVLADRSANGTWVQPDGQPAIALRREELPLGGSGTLYLGAEPGLDAEVAVRYQQEG